jgi:beta-galactosidase/beta-glucuronidase
VDVTEPEGDQGGYSEPPRPEYPRPQFVRQHWLCLNGEWEFEVDQGDSGLERGLVEQPLRDKILVPFAPESKLSGVENNDFFIAVWYRRTQVIPEEWTGQQILLHFQAVDYDTTVWVNGQQVGHHRGGFSPFSFDISAACDAGQTATIVVRARDLPKALQARGKQSTRLEPYAAFYPRTTGIWQTVWMEPVPRLHLKRARITPDVAGSGFHIEVPVTGNTPGTRVELVLTDDDGDVATWASPTDLDLTVRCTLRIPDARVRLWSMDDPHLYGLTIRLLDDGGTVVDSVRSYAGLRSVAIDGRAILINGERVFQRLVLDQGYYPDGVMTAPSDADLIRDIELSQAAGFNGARLHQKVFEERFLYHADRLGYLVWGEFGDWGCNGRTDGGDQRPDISYVSQWLEVLERDYSHPSIIGWCPLNETYEQLRDDIATLDDATRAMFLATKAYDTSRPVLDASGYSHRVTEADVYDSHNYQQDPSVFARDMAGTAAGSPYVNTGPNSRVWSVPYGGQPYFCSEFGGIWWSTDAAPGPNSWGYGAPPRTEAEFLDRFAGLVDVLLDDPAMFGYCYTQLTDVYQECNGLYTFDRKAKFDISKLREIQSRAAEYECQYSR